VRKSLAPDDSRDLLRELAALLIALGAAMWVLRTGAAAGAFASFCILAIPACLLLWMALSDFPSQKTTRPWQAVDATVGIVLAVLALRQLANWLGEPGDASNGINIFWTFSLGAAIAAWSARKAGVRFQILLACLLSAIALAGLLNVILSGGVVGSFGVFRGLMFIYALVLAGIGVRIWRSDQASEVRSVSSELTDPEAGRSLRNASEVFTSAAVVAVFACGYGITSALGLIPTIADIDSAGSGIIWEVLLLLVGVVSVVAGAGIGSRGLTWAGGIGLILFFFIVGADVHSGQRRPDAFGVWPAVLLGLGVGFLIVSLVPESSLGRAPKRLVERLRSGGRSS